MTEGAIYEAMPKIMAEVRAVEKTKRNESLQYNFRGFDDVYAAVRQIMAKYGVFATHTISEHRWEERTTSKGNAMYWVCAVFNVTFWAKDGSNVVTQSFGEAMDSGDKAANKAMSMAMKYALVDTFLIPTGEPRDTENDHEETVGAARKEPPVPKRQTVSPDSREWTGEAIIPFGKHKGRMWKEIEGGYVSWAAENMKPPAKEYAAKELGRRAKAESEPIGPYEDDAPPFMVPEGETF